MIKASTTITGSVALDKELAGLERKIQRKILAKSTRESVKIVLADVKRYAPLGETGLLQRSYTVRTATNSRGGRLPRDVIGNAVVTDKRRFPDQFYGSFQELGTKYIDATDTLREGLYTNQGPIKQTFQSNARRGINEIASESRAKRPTGK